MKMRILDTPRVDGRKVAELTIGPWHKPLTDGQRDAVDFFVRSARRKGLDFTRIDDDGAGTVTVVAIDLLPDRRR